MVFDGSVQKIAEWAVISLVGFVCKYIIDMKKSLDSAHRKIRDIEREVERNKDVK